MLWVDTNIIVRILTDDDARQRKIAAALFASERIWIGKTVILETEWVLRSVYKFEPAIIREALARVLRLPNVVLEDDVAMLRAVALMEHGIDFADAMHVSGRPSGSPFVSFDRAFVRRAKRAGVADVAELGA
jgi:predicted nucleic-acid-binding protein